MSDKQKIVDAIVRLARRLRRTPSQAEYTAHTRISPHSVTRWFRSWNAAVRAARLSTYTLNVKIPTRAMLEDWGRAVRKNRGIPPRHMYRRNGKYNPCSFARRFGGWTRVPQAFRQFAKGKRKWADVVLLLPADVERAYVSRALKPCACAPPGEHRRPSDDSVPFVPLNEPQHAPLEDRPTYGNPFGFRGLRHEPTNEQGVVLLFGMLAEELGYRIEAIQNGFPDCEALRRVGPDRWQRVSIEFEFESRNFRDHGHPLIGCDVIVCWRHNWPDCPEHLEVLELSKIKKSE